MSKDSAVPGWALWSPYRALCQSGVGPGCDVCPPYHTHAELYPLLHVRRQAVRHQNPSMDVDTGRLGFQGQPGLQETWSQNKQSINRMHTAISWFLFKSLPVKPSPEQGFQRKGCSVLWTLQQPCRTGFAGESKAVWDFLFCAWRSGFHESVEK